jgi:hypothetical protein
MARVLIEYHIGARCVRTTSRRSCGTLTTLHSRDQAFDSSSLDVDRTGSSAHIAVRALSFFVSDDVHLTGHLAEIFRLPYELLVDTSPGQRLYRVLGMGRISSGAQKSHCPTDHAVGSYVRHGAVSGLAMVVAHALRVGMPVWERGGDASQLGGEFVLGPGYVHTPLFFICI